MEKNLPKRETDLDLVKTIAIFCVLCIHSCAYGDPVLSVSWTSNVFWGSITRAAVPLFLMCSGALFLSPDRPFSLKKLFTRTIPRALLALFVWATLYRLLHLLSAGFTPEGLVQAVKDVFTFQHEFHLYYLQIILLVYLFLPLTRLVTEHADKKLMQYLLLLWFLFGIVLPTVEFFPPFTMFPATVAWFKITQAYAAIGYGLLGHYLKRCPAPRPWLGWAELLGGFAVIFGGTLFLSVRSGYLNTTFLEGMSLGTALLAAGIFRVCCGVSLGPRAKAAVVFLSKASFCVYLVHVVFNRLLPRCGFTSQLLPPIVGVPVYVCVLMVLSLAVYLVLSRIPVVNRWLI